MRWPDGLDLGIRLNPTIITSNGEFFQVLVAQCVSVLKVSGSSGPETDKFRWPRSDFSRLNANSEEKKQECIPVGCLPFTAVESGGRASARGGGLYSPPGPRGRHTPRTEFPTHACKNITFPQPPLRAVKTISD